MRLGDPYHTGHCPCPTCMGRDPDVNGTATDELELFLEYMEKDHQIDPDWLLEYMSDSGRVIEEIEDVMRWRCPDCVVSLLETGMCPSCLESFSNFVGK